MANANIDYLTSIKSIFGDSAEITGTGKDAVLSFKPAETGDMRFNSPETARPEALLLALLQTAFNVQSITPSRAMEVNKTAILATKSGGQVTGEQYIVRIFSARTPVGISPDLV
jgi:hypothetical protein